MRERMLQKWLAASVAAILIALLNFSGRSHSAESIKFALPGNSMGYLPLWVAIHRGFFKDEAIEIEVPRLVPTIAHNALMAGEVQYHGLADSALGLAARGAPLKAIFYGADRPMYFLMARKEIRSVADLKGKKVGISRYGGTSDLSARLVVRNFGVQPERDAAVLQIGSESGRIAALRAGGVDAVIVPVPANVLLKRQGFNQLSFVGDVIEFASNGYTTTDQRLKEHPQEVKRVVRALYRGLRFAKDRPEETIGIIQKEWKVEADVAKESYSSIIMALNDDGIIGEKQLNVHFDIIRVTGKDPGEIPLDKVVDFRLLKEVRRELSGR
jgi:ABC-type nitrate/sulfonate/bicarbonate transport system substrate-binding protein